MPENTKELFSTPFSPSYWKAAAGELKSTKKLVLTALFIALQIALSAFFIPVGANLRIFFTFFITALGGLIYGPVLALIAGLLNDLIGYMVHPSGPFFWGYILTSMAGALIYALFFYRTRITIVKIALAKLCVNVFVNIGLNCLWSQMLYGKGYLYYLAKSLVKNIALLPVEIIILVLFFQLMLPVLYHTKLVVRQPTNRIPVI